MEKRCSIFSGDVRVGSIPNGHEIDVPLNYADCYSLEALVRYKHDYQKN